MTWASRALGEFARGDDMQQALQNLLQQQRHSWPLFARGEQALYDLQRRPVPAGSDDLVLQANPRRKRSSGAKLDAKSIAARACFLCEKNLPAEERGLLFAKNWFVVANPFPIVPGHLSIPSTTHQPQALRNNIDAMFDLALALPQHTIFYNGPRCGASAPDHLHFQACLRKHVPGLAQLDLGASQARPTRQTPKVMSRVLRWPARQALLLSSSNRGALLAAARRSLDMLAQIKHGDDEAMLNAFAFVQGGNMALVIFPRARHRPDCFYAKGEARILVSPGALDMAGLMVVADLEHFARLDDDKVCDIYAQVSLSNDLFNRWIEELA